MTNIYVKKYAVMTSTGAHIVYAKSKKEALLKFQQLNAFVNISLKDIYLY